MYLNDWTLLQRAVEASRAETRALQKAKECAHDEISERLIESIRGLGFAGGADGLWNRPGASWVPNLLKNQTRVVALRGTGREEIS